MRMFSRIVRLCKADIHGVMDRIEDKELLLKQYLREMEEVLFKQKARLGDLTASRNRMQQELETYAAKSRKLEKGIEAAVIGEKNDLARMLIKQNQTVSTIQHEIQCAINRLEHQIEELTENLGQKQLSYEQIRHRSTAYMQQMEQQKWEVWEPALDVAPIDQNGMAEAVELELYERKQALKGEKSP